MGAVQSGCRKRIRDIQPIHKFIMTTTSEPKVSDVAELAKGNGDFLKSNLSTTLVASNAPDAIDPFISAAVDLFANFQRLEESVTIQPSTDSYGNTGYSFAMEIVNTDETRTPFKIYIILENNTFKVANITD